MDTKLNIVIVLLLAIVVLMLVNLVRPQGLSSEAARSINTQSSELNDRSFDQ